jgi:hypothetical protein
MKSLVATNSLRMYDARVAIKNKNTLGEFYVMACVMVLSSVVHRREGCAVRVIMTVESCMWGKFCGLFDAL